MKIITMKKNFLFLLFLTPLIINTAEQAYRFALREAIETKNKEKVRTIINQLPKGTIPKVALDHYLPGNQNPLFIDTSPAIVKILLDSGVSPAGKSHATSFNQYPIDAHTDYKSIALLLSRGGELSQSTSLYTTLTHKKDHRITCIILMAGAKTQFGHSQHFSCFPKLKKLLQNDPSPENMAWGFLNWAAMTIATDKEEGWKKKLEEIISLYRTPQLERLDPRKIQERQKIRTFNTEEKCKHIFQNRYKDAFESWLKS